jgi:hypothetical protein
MSSIREKRKRWVMIFTSPQPLKET